MRSIAVRIAFLSRILCVVTANQQYMMCKTVDDIFSTSIPQQADVQQGSTDKLSGIIGPPGKRGPPGRPGPAGDVDYQIISDMLDVKIREGLPCIMSGGILSSDKCFIIPNTNAINFEQAKDACTSIRATIAEINNGTQQTSLQNRLSETKIPSSRTRAFFWLGMRLDVSARVVRYESGKEIPYNQFVWHPDNPSGPNVHIGIEVNNDGSDHLGLFNESPDTMLHGVICEKLL